MCSVRPADNMISLLMLAFRGVVRRFRPMASKTPNLVQRNIACHIRMPNTRESAHLCFTTVAKLGSNGQMFDAIFTVWIGGIMSPIGQTRPQRSSQRIFEARFHYCM